MKTYIAGKNHAYGTNPNPQLLPFPGCIALNDEQTEMLLQYNGFIKIISEDPVEIEPDVEAWEAWKAEQPDPLDAIKEQRIAQSKTDLAAYLESNPLLWMDGQYYSITAEKQAQLTGKIMAATMAQTLSQPYTLTWNSTGEVCKEWTLVDLSALAFAIDSRVTALVSYQQTQEVAIRNATTREELDGIVVDYDTV